MAPLVTVVALLAASSLAHVARGFTFTYSAPTECGELTVEWEGGTPPFHLMKIPYGGTLQNISIPDSNFVDGKGTFSTPMTSRASRMIALAMSDSTGLTTGGITQSMTVGPRQSGSQACNLTESEHDFYWSWGSQRQLIEQCQDLIFTDFQDARLPVTVYAFVPGGESLMIGPKADSSFTWKLALPAGTPITFWMTDADGRNGGLSQLYTVGASSDDSCLADRGNNSSGDSDDDDKNGGGAPVGAIVGGAVGGAAALAIAVFLAVYFSRRPKAKGIVQPLMEEGGAHGAHGAFTGGASAYSPSPSGPASPDYRQSTFTASSPPHDSSNASFAASQMAAGQIFVKDRGGHGVPPSSYHNPSDRHNSFYASSDVSYQASSGSGSRGSQYPLAHGQVSESGRVIVHSDITESSNAVEELPPQYSDSRPPIQGLGEGSSTPVGAGKS
ncbi:hypothetical protein CC1G_02176 [Coprinopsis cinerea okayama7|uniref:Uncharacterized protein n=1 Tax=Coprinopsis cinerea (strain Okayama-7 / 130 / ATCC MYA-4618 / FGSC 9003) TaxID=240176 RepID=A8NKG2_COPC7|nr:hypothetical protein CC1G_02176 [Coprinopsis cinerea okayama7\|eukprot:XP_001834440.1 hypothetical protein CC1G_02176 [Coprinopsis cinerea okayama7\